MDDNTDRPIYLPLTHAAAEHEDTAPGDTAALVQIAGQFGRLAIDRYRAENPDGFMALAKLFQSGGAKFDLTVRDVTGMAPCIELVASLADRDVVIASQVLRRRAPARPN